MAVIQVITPEQVIGFWEIAVLEKREGSVCGVGERTRVEREYVESVVQRECSVYVTTLVHMLFNLLVNVLFNILANDYNWLP